MKRSSFWPIVAACLVLMAAPALFGFDFSELE